MKTDAEIAYNAFRARAGGKLWGELLDADKADWQAVEQAVRKAICAAATASDSDANGLLCKCRAMNRVEALNHYRGKTGCSLVDARDALFPVEAAFSAVPSGMQLVNAGALSMVINALRRDAEEGKVVRGEMADELLKTAASSQA